MMQVSSQKGEVGLGGAMASAMGGPLDCLDSSRVTTLKVQHPNAPDDNPPRIALFAFGAAIHD
ncbi:hypothetical protein AA0113_g6813 [Alternaria arborescens]|uniref:Uncharacterized protein n=1 Tax=Alternaria arborescens TaxID=156630 RepID=A0A4Q4RW95_9PLEO|nr:hypothetical protein AA0113_g6813 [Alternaria arborescens]